MGHAALKNTAERHIKHYENPYRLCSAQNYVHLRLTTNVRDHFRPGRSAVQLHEEPQIPNYGIPNNGPLIKAGMCFAIEPMVTLKSYQIFTKEDQWTICTVDGFPAAHFEHTITVTEDGAKILTV